MKSFISKKTVLGVDVVLIDEVIPHAQDRERFFLMLKIGKIPMYKHYPASIALTSSGKRFDFSETLGVVSWKTGQSFDGLYVKTADVLPLFDEQAKQARREGIVKAQKEGLRNVASAMAVVQDAIVDFQDASMITRKFIDETLSGAGFTDSRVADAVWKALPEKNRGGAPRKK